MHVNLYRSDLDLNRPKTPHFFTALFQIVTPAQKNKQTNKILFFRNQLSLPLIKSDHYLNVRKWRL